MSKDVSVKPEWYAEIPRSTRMPTFLGVLILAVTAAGFGVWGHTAPIAGAVVAGGIFVATGQNKIVQHLEGGVVREILVREGDIVRAGQPLIHLDETSPRAELRRLELRRIRLLAIDARLQAEMKEQTELAFPDAIIPAAHDADVNTILESQKLTFDARRKTLESDIATIRESIKALHERIEGSKIQLKGVHEQIAFIEEEIEAKTHLLKTGLVRKPEVLLLQRARANLQGEVGRLHGEIGDAKERIARALEQIAGTKKAAIKAAVEQLHEARAELNDVRERVRAAKGVLDRVRITAPVNGVVVKLRYHTSGGVIEAGKNILEILPLDEELLIEARVRPQDIDSVKRGQEAMVRLTALSQRVTPMVSGEVVYLSADALPDEKRGTQATSDVYVVRVKLNAIDATLQGFTPTPGMPAELYIKTADRTFFQYLVKPIEDSMSRAFRER